TSDSRSHNSSGSSEIDPRHVATLVAAYTALARLGARDEVVLEAAGAALQHCALQGRPVPPDYLPALVKALATKLRPAPLALARAVEASLPEAVPSLKIQDLSMVLQSLAFIPGLRAAKGGLGQRLFGGCLAAPLSALPPAGLVGALRSAWAMDYFDPSFWAPALRDAERRLTLSSEGQHLTPMPRQAGIVFAPDDLAGAALISARVVAAAAEASKATSPAAAAEAAARQAAARIEELGPRELGMIGTALAKSGHEDGQIFALLSHRALQLLQSGPQFNSLDVSQLLAALAHFSYRDEALLDAVAAQLERGLATYDPKARDIVLWSFSELGGLPGGARRYPALGEALLEYELSLGYS
ncbi:unnamed protein product, partial [Polarella glacialis]